jgi:hypothetical protein
MSLIPTQNSTRIFQLYEAGLASFLAAQQQGAMDAVYLQLGNKGKYVNLRIPLVAFIIGDNQGGDSIAGRSAFYGQSVHHISHTCDATPETYGIIEPDCCSPLNMGEIQAMVIAQDWEGINNLHQCPCWNPFLDVCHMVVTLAEYLLQSAQLKPYMPSKMASFHTHCAMPLVAISNQNKLFYLILRFSLGQNFPGKNLLGSASMTSKRMLTVFSR